MNDSSHRTLIAHVADRPGVLERVASLIRRRAFNIESLGVGRAAELGVARMTFVLAGDVAEARLLEANLRKLLDVIDVHDVTDQPVVQAELALVKITVGAGERARVVAAAGRLGGRVVDRSGETYMIEMTWPGISLDELADALAPARILEVARTGCVAMTRGAAVAAVGPREETT